MTIQELEHSIICHGLVIRGIPHETTFCCEMRHKDKYPNDRVEVFNSALCGRDMIRVTRKNKNGGKIIIAQLRDTGTVLNSWRSKQGKVCFYNSIEEAVNDFLAEHSKDL